MTDTEFCFKVKYTELICKEKLDGRILLLVSSNDKSEPRFQISDGGNTQLIFGIDIDDHSPGENAVIDEDVSGYPLDSIKDIPKGEYWVQAVLHKYETFHRADGHVVKLPMDRGEGQKWNKAPGNLFSTPKKVSIDPSSKESISIILDSIIPNFPPYEDTRYVKNIRIESKLLSEF